MRASSRQNLLAMIPPVLWVPWIAEPEQECQMLGCGLNSPPQPRRGGCAAKKSCEATLTRADGVVLIKRMIFLTSTTPAAAAASALPSSAEEGSCRPYVGQQPRQPWVKNVRSSSRAAATESTL